MTVTEAVPLAVWGARQRDGKDWAPWHSWPHWLEAERWAIARGYAGGGLATYRIEFYLIGVPFALVFRYALNDDGRRFMADRVVRRPALADPVTVILDELPPPELLGPADDGGETVTALDGDHLDEFVFGPPAHEAVPHSHDHPEGQVQVPPAGTHWHEHGHPPGDPGALVHNHRHGHAVPETEK